MPFDGKRMIMGGFDAIVEEGSPGGGYTDGFVVPVPEGKRDAYRELAAKMAKVFREHGATRVIEAFGDDVSARQGHRLLSRREGRGRRERRLLVHRMARQGDPRRGVEGKIMSDESLKPEGEMPFDGKRMFWGGFEKIVDTAGQTAAQQAGAPVTA